MLNERQQGIDQGSALAVQEETIGVVEQQRTNSSIENLPAGIRSQAGPMPLQRPPEGCRGGRGCVKKKKSPKNSSVCCGSFVFFLYFFRTSILVARLAGISSSVAVLAACSSARFCRAFSTFPGLGRPLCSHSAPPAPTSAMPLSSPRPRLQVPRGASE